MNQRGCLWMFVIAVALLLVRALLGCFYAVHQIEQVIVTQFGKPVGDPEKFADGFFGWIAFTFPFNATGQPAISLPNGFTKAGLPIGLQIVGRPADECGIIALAAAWEEARPWAGQHPPLD